MYVCVCAAVSESELRQAVREGAHTLRALREGLGVGAQCGRCARCARDILHDELAHAHRPSGKVLPLHKVA
ncbi:bacterioferritin-associated ferredoxin [Acidithiobacillus sp. IBUN Pt1247-S3]|uniref:bacterioferritin-associated ferredoxin n=1 Tax=Acidithiobacillus sp. IBUN Pt1247-S3 TaxID=3166642 RepID=UPI0034E3CAB7